MVELQQAGFHAALIPLLPDTFRFAATEAWGPRLSEALAGERVRGLVVDGAAGLAGLVVYGLNRDAEPTPGAGEIQALFVDPDRWRQGVGRVLLDAACADLEQMGYAAVTLWSLRDNDRANAFYERLGFARDGATQTRAAFGAPEIRYARSLPYYTF